MKPGDKELDAQIQALLALDEHRSHPLYDALAALHARNQDQLTRLERITRIADGYHSLARTAEQSMAERFNRQLRQLEKLARISDRYQQQLREANIKLQEAASHDGLTGLINRRRMDEYLSSEAERSGRHAQPFALAMLDVDHFKLVNDQFGHDVGDRVLISVAQTVIDQLRDYDQCARWGGEEFMLLLPQTSLAEAIVVLERVRESISTQLVPAGSHNLSVTVSVGLTCYQPGEHVEDTVRRADQAMLESKRAGRNRLSTK
ncbi:biofilm regulation diguanylate cyclase SiaD [Massilia sp. TS11]|uniref:biofilm regulation diguanylate cyclase SiaD n=1 Tax=Massilia sp. TS11 TaxID=2908003 RepID=UPI001EDB5A88|nr:biofilm regulation diguanylate cyclase SiaD [Massilia sp. TS11]MCG2586890.1 biofilm regulation diguanylate cyclase SiaD [Massilia sp. TS11]